MKEQLTAILFPVFVVLSLLLVIVPIRAGMLDVLLLCNLGLALLVVFLSASIRRPSEFSVFPTLLLLLTLFRLSLNVASTRMILSNGANFGGVIIRAFGRWVVGGNYVVGAVVFLILVIIQFMVITRGAERVAEVAARFRLDALPMKQMGIESALSSGMLTEEGAALARKEIQSEIDFYGAMDGASRFIKGETIASLFIVCVNILGGLSTGLLNGGFAGFGDVFRTYTLLTIGDGLVGLIPSLLVSTAAGIIITRSSSDASLSQDLASQLGREPRALVMALAILSALMLIFAAFSGVSPGIFIVLGGGLAYAAWFVSNQTVSGDGEKEGEASESVLGGEDLDVGLVHPVEIVLETSLWQTWENQGVLDKLRVLTAGIRRKVYREKGLPIKPLALSFSGKLKPRSYSLRLRTEEIASGRIPAGRLLAVAEPGEPCDVEGEFAVNPRGRGKARWISPDSRDEVIAAGLSVLDPEEVIEAHVSTVVLGHADELLGLQELDELYKGVADNFPAIAQALDETGIERVVLLTVLRLLLSEGVSVRNAPAIFESLVEFGRACKDPHQLVERVRGALSRQISRDLADDDRVIHAVTISSDTERQLYACLFSDGETPSDLALSPDRALDFIDAIGEAAACLRRRGRPPVFIVERRLRRQVLSFARRYVPDIRVLSQDEVHASCSIKRVRTLTLPHEEAVDNVVEFPGEEQAIGGPLPRREAR